ncbi:MAG: 3-phosphoshikimate 1-carboxyvinyltransferase [Ruminococcus sp.]|nr:3-phosphoshikimate 1-carboxyvinyltransferase [Ruminococcus sp.]
MNVRIYPSKAKGIVKAPPSKSMAHRYLICAGLAEGESVVRNLAFSKDIEATVNCLRALGADIRIDGDAAYITGVDVAKPTGTIQILPCNESGSTLRFLIPICFLNGEEHVLTGSEYLMQRPLSVYEKITHSLELRLERFEDKVIVKGKLQRGLFEVPGNISSQFISGLMFALPLLNQDSRICVAPPVESFPYIDMTVDALQSFGIDVKHGYYQIDHCFFWIIPSGKYIPADITVEGDYSNAAFFEALNFAGSDVTVTGLNPDSLQGDKVYNILFEKIKSGEAVDLSDCPDLGPVAFAVAALLGKGVFTGTKRLRLKESDRVSAMQEELEKFGIDMVAFENTVSIGGVLRPPKEPLYGHNDHRIVMALSVLLTVTGGVIEGADAVEKSFPDFFDRLRDLGVNLAYGMDQ